MKTLVFSILLISLLNYTNAQTKPGLYKNSHVEDRLAIKNLVDTFSVLADVKDIENQVLLFTPDATVQSFRDGQSNGLLKGREMIGKAFADYLTLFETVYYINGQLTLTLNGNKATGISYCTVTLIGMESGQKMKTTMGVIYHDKYVKEKGKWFIEQRESNFTWTEKSMIKQ